MDEMTMKLLDEKASAILKDFRKYEGVESLGIMTEWFSTTRQKEKPTILTIKFTACIDDKKFKVNFDVDMLNYNHSESVKVMRDAIIKGIQGKTLVGFAKLESNIVFMDGKMSIVVTLPCDKNGNVTTKYEDVIAIKDFVTKNTTKNVKIYFCPDIKEVPIVVLDTIYSNCVKNYVGN